MNELLRFYILFNSVLFYIFFHNSNHKKETFNHIYILKWLHYVEICEMSVYN